MFGQPKEENKKPVKQRMCPLLKEVCKNTCAWYIGDAEEDTENGMCSIYRIANNN